MLTVDQATSAIASKTPQCPVVKVSLQEAYGKILAQDILSERDQPPFDRMAMDGIAIDFDEYQKGRRQFKVAGIQSAGQPQQILENKEDCLEGMTGGVLPKNATAVIRYEDISIENNIATIADELVFNMFNNVHQKASDHKEGEIVLKKGTILNGPQLGIIAANGYADVTIYADPKIAVISTGDELVDLGETPLDHQIRRSNPYAMKAELNCFQFNNVTLFHLLDNEKELYQQLEKILNEFDILVLSGGVSAGKYDFLPQVFADLNVEKVFHKVAQRPGKPLWFGNKEEKLIFALPGNPVSAITCLRRYVVPALLSARGQRAHIDKAVLAEDYAFNKDLTYFCPVIVSVSSDGVLKATPMKTNGSGDYGSLAYSDGILELDKETNFFEKGSTHKLFLWGKN